MMKKGIIKSSILLFMMILFVSSKPKNESPEDYSKFLDHYEDFINYCNQQHKSNLRLSLLANENKDEDTMVGIHILDNLIMSNQDDIQNLYDIMYIYNLADPLGRAKTIDYVYVKILSIHYKLNSCLLIMDNMLEKYENENQHTLSVEYSVYIRRLNTLIETVVRNKSEIISEG